MLTTTVRIWVVIHITPDPRLPQVHLDPYGGHARNKLNEILHEITGLPVDTAEQQEHAMNVAENMGHTLHTRSREVPLAFDLNFNLTLTEGDV